MNCLTAQELFTRVCLGVNELVKITHVRLCLPGFRLLVVNESSNIVNHLCLASAFRKVNVHTLRVVFVLAH